MSDLVGKDELSEQSKKYTNNFNSYLMAEYDNIAQAHFKTIDTISEFFKHYLTIITIPITLLAIAVNLDFVKNSLNQLTTPGTTSNTGKIISILFLIIGAIGFMVFWYVLNLRWDALLYARTVNGIRKYFYDLGGTLDLLGKERIRVLPQSPLLPEFREFYFFGPVVFAFTIFNSLYFVSGVFGAYYFSGQKDPFRLWPFWLSATVFALSHIFLYNRLAERREYGKQRFHIMGVDIDGVLNLHRDQFARIFKEQTLREIDPQKITVIPVRDCKHLCISRIEEFAVFNDPEYWISMPRDPNAGKVLSSLRNSYKIRIHVFTSRPWPITVSEISDTRKAKLVENWVKRSKLFQKEVYLKDNLWQKIKRKINILIQIYPYRTRNFSTFFHKRSALEKITRAWLDKCEIPYDRLVVEYGSEDAADPSAHVYNRFYAARTMPIKFFVEDDIRKAKKLAYICDIVFLIDHPYNQDKDLPNNVIRVKSWNELLQYMRDIA